MNQIANTNLDFIIDSLYEACKSSIFNLYRYKAPKPDLLKEIEEINNPNAIFSLIPLMFAKNKTVSKIAIKKVDTLLKTIPLKDLNKIDEQIRRLDSSKHFEEISKNWYNLKPSIVASQNDHSIESITKLKILCCHRDGYIRYKAIKKLVETNIQEAIPFLIIRINDWVEEIRRLCFTAINNIIKNKQICYFVESLPLLKQLKTKGRYEHDQIELTSKIESILATQCSDALFSKINSHEIIGARYAFSILASADSKIEHLLNLALHQKDIIIKLNAFDLASKRYDHNQFLIYLNKIKDDKLMPIRKMVLYKFVEHYPQQSKKNLENALLDCSRSIRNLSRYYLKQQGVDEFSTYYKDAITRQDKRIKSAILGLSESGNTLDFSYIRPFVTNNISTFNAAIIKAAFKMQPEDWKNIIAHILSTPDSTTLKSFANCILENQESYTFEEILELVYKKNNLMHIRYLIKILSKSHYDRWMVLNFILCELQTVTDHDVKVAFEEYLPTWIYHNSPNKIFVRTSNEKSKMCLDKATNLLKNNLNHPVYKALLENIKCFIT